MFSALLLDLDDTLYDRGAAFTAWAQEQARVQRGRGLEPAELTALRVIDRRGHRPRTQFAAEARVFGLTVNPERFPFQLAEHVVPEGGVRETIAALARTRRVGIVTNGGSAQRAKLARIGLDGIVHAVFVSQEIGVAKPDPAIFTRALAWTEQSAGSVLFVGDEPNVDLVPAAALGMATAWRVRTEWPTGVAPPTYRLTSITELTEACA